MAEANQTSRLEAFCDGVFAIALTLLIIDIKLPSSENITNTKEFWQALTHIAPTLFAFVLSFIVILITWVNHHNTLKLVSKSSASFIYANGFLLITVVFIPFPTSLMGEYILTDHSSPAVVLYQINLMLQAVGWILMTRTALNDQLARNESSAIAIRKSGQFSYYASALYAVCAIVAFWFPVSIAVFTTLTWVFWLVFGINIKDKSSNNLQEMRS